MKIRKYIIAMLCCTGLLGACTDEEKITSLSDDRQEILLSGSIEQLYTSRVNGSGFTDRDTIGVYVVDYLYEKDPGILKTTGNRADNIFFSYNELKEEWRGESAIYWGNKFTPIDVFSYYPYREQVTDVVALPFAVYQDQSAVVAGQSKYGYELSDFLWAKAEKEYSKVEVVNLEHHHIMSKVKVDLYMGSGFTAEEWQKLEKTVTVHNVVAESVIDLSTGVVTAVKGSKPLSITPYKDKDCFHAIVVPQQLPASTDLLTIQVGKKSYTYQRAALTTYEAGKNRTYSIIVDKEVPKGDYTFKVMSESITPWQDDTFSHNGQVKEYLVVKNPQAGKLADEFQKMNVDVSKIKNLKIIGSMEPKDFYFIKNNIPDLEGINLQEVKVSDYGHDYNNDTQNVDDAIPSGAFYEMRSLEQVVFPKELKYIGAGSFYHTNLYGSLEIPEGVVFIGDEAFTCMYEGDRESSVSSRLIGELTLPSTLKYIGKGAFARLPLSGNLIIPDGVEFIGESAFESCTYFSGDLRLPNSVKEIGLKAFYNLDGIYGELVLPEGLTRLEEGCFLGHFSSITWPKNLSVIGPYALAGSVHGDLEIPNTVQIIEGSGFENCPIRHIKFGDALTIMEDYAFAGCDLRDTLYLPKNIRTLPEFGFSGNKRLDAIVIPAAVEHLEYGVFDDIFSLSYVRSDAKTPPTLEDASFVYGFLNKTILEVPKESVDAYRNAPGWRRFGKITSYRNFVCYPQNIKALNAGTTRTLDLQADANWKVTHVPSWCHLSVSEGFKKARLDFRMDALEKGQGSRNDSIVFTLEDEEQHTCYVKLEQYDYQYEEDEVVTLQKATVGNGIDLVFVGDGYDAKDIYEGAYLKDMQQEMDMFFDVEPYASYRAYFNVYTPVALSNQQGVSSAVANYDTKFDTNYGRDEGHIYTEKDHVMSYIQKCLPSVKLNRALAILIPNGTEYDGKTYLWDDGSALSVCSKSNFPYPYDARGVIQHEACGHGFAKLADEYYSRNALIYQDPELEKEIVAGKSKGYFANVSLDGTYQTNEWKDLIFDPRYSDAVDLYEGAFYYARGVFRPEWNSCMNNNVPYFNAPSRMEIVKRIKTYAGESFDFEEFVKLDAKARESATTRSGLGVLKEQRNMHMHHGPVLLEGSPLLTK